VRLIGRFRLFIVESCALWRALIIAVEPLGLCAVEPWPLVVHFMMRIPRISVFDRELAMPLPVWGRVRLVDVNMTALTQRD
jgi:hypothetical protein